MDRLLHNFDLRIPLGPPGGELREGPLGRACRRIPVEDGTAA